MAATRLPRLSRSPHGRAAQADHAIHDQCHAPRREATAQAVLPWSKSKRISSAAQGAISRPRRSTSTTGQDEAAGRIVDVHSYPPPSARAHGAPALFATGPVRARTAADRRSIRTPSGRFRAKSAVALSYAAQGDRRHRRPMLETPLKEGPTTPRPISMGFFYSRRMTDACARDINLAG